MIGLPVGLLLSNATEWLVHKYILHGQGRSRQSFWSFHFHEHHRHVRTSGGHDPAYEGSVFAWNARGKEALALAGVALAVAPLLPVAPWFTVTSWACAYNYYRVHKKSHLDPAWARVHVPWHYDHHMGPDQDANWCVTSPWFDHVMGTRVPYLGTERARDDAARRARRTAAGAGVTHAAG